MAGTPVLSLNVGGAPQPMTGPPMGGPPMGGQPMGAMTGPPMGAQPHPMQIPGAHVMG